MAYDFHYTPTGTGVISGKEVLEQTEDAINDLGNTAISGVQEALDKAEQALTNSENAVDDAQTALNTANNAEGVAIQAQTDVGNLSGTVANIGNRVTTAEGNITNLQGRMTTAEGNITNIQGRMTTAESNIGNLQTAVSTAQATANSAQQTATTARQQSYVFRYSGTAVVPNSTIAYSTIDNTDNIKAGDKILDVDGKLFEITAVDTTNQTVTVGTALIDLALDANVVHTSGNETISGAKYFTVSPQIYNSDSTASEPNLIFKNSKYAIGDTTDTGEQRVIFADKNNAWAGYISSSKSISGVQYLTFRVFNKDSNDTGISSTISYAITKNGDKYFAPSADSQINLGSTSYRWKGIYATNYYYGASNVEFSTKFVTTDTAQTISGSKTFTDNVKIKNTDVTRGTTTGSGTKNITYTDSNDDELSSISVSKNSNGSTSLVFKTSSTDNTDTVISSSFQFFVSKSGSKVINPTTSDEIALGRSTNKWLNVATSKVNNLEPSSLSLPNGNINSFVDISGYFTNTGTGETNTYPVTANGWIYLRLSNISGCQAEIYDSSNNRLYATSTSGSIEQIMIPVVSGVTFKTQWATGSAVTVNIARFIPCQGNI